jgi:hypothetical protein
MASARPQPHAEPHGWIIGVGLRCTQLQLGALGQQSEKHLALTQRRLRRVSLLSGDMGVGSGDIGHDVQVHGVGFERQQPINQLRLQHVELHAPSSVCPSRRGENQPRAVRG